jgi:hypothetical protein
MVVFEGMTIDELWKNIDAEMRKRGVDNSDPDWSSNVNESHELANKLVKVLGRYSFAMAESSMLNDLLASYGILKGDFEHYVEKLRVLLGCEKAIKRLLIKRLLRKRAVATERLLLRLDRSLAEKRLYRRLAKK